MPLFCPKCGTKLAGDFKFCPNCGKNLKGKFSYCPECGKKMPIGKTTKNKISLPRLSLHMPRKAIIAVVVIICLAAVGATAVIVINPFKTSGIQSAGRTFPVSIENTFGADANCYLKIGLLKYGDTFVVPSGQTETISLEEDTFLSSLIRNEYNITLYAAIEDLQGEMIEWASADPVTTSAEFVISKDIFTNYIVVECTDFQ
jgi:hypothetical protein